MEKKTICMFHQGARCFKPKTHVQFLRVLSKTKILLKFEITFYTLCQWIPTTAPGTTSAPKKYSISTS